MLSFVLKNNTCTDIHVCITSLLYYTTFYMRRRVNTFNCVLSILIQFVLFINALTCFSFTSIYIVCCNHFVVVTHNMTVIQLRVSPGFKETGLALLSLLNFKIWYFLMFFPLIYKISENELIVLKMNRYTIIHPITN